MSSQILLVFTFKLSGFEKVLPCLDTWLACRNVHALCLIEENDVVVNEQQFHAATSLFRFFEIYQYRDQSKIEYGCPSLATRKSSPRLSQVIMTMKKYEGYSHYGYVNSDIEYAGANCKDKFCSAIDNLTDSQKILMCHRHDYISSRALLSVYNQGFDLVIIPNSILHRLTLLPTVKEFQIGQVGWDYILPMSLRRDLVQTTDKILIRHKKHPTGSDASWEVAMITCMKNIEPSWFAGKPLTRALFLMARYFYSLMSRHRFCFLKSSLSKLVIEHLFSRLFFYLVVNRLLLRRTLRESLISR